MRCYIRINLIIFFTCLALFCGSCKPDPQLAEPTSLPNPTWWQMDFLPAKRELVSSNGLVAMFYAPAKGAGPWHPVVLLPGSQGGMAKGKSVNSLILSGYCVITPAYIHEGEDLISVPLEFFDKTLKWLRHDNRVLQDGVAVIGRSKGGELALLLASRKNEITAVIGIVPSSHVFQGIASKRHSKSSWSYQGEDISFLPYSMQQAWLTSITTQKYRKVYEVALEKCADHPEARIPIEKSNAAILLLSGRKDEMWPSTPMCDDIVNHLKQSSYSHTLEHVSYDCGHNVGNAKEHWIRITTFLRENYGVKIQTQSLVPNTAKGDEAN